MSRITPEMFSSERPPQRIIGVECEYVIQNTDEYGNETAPASSFITPLAKNRSGMRYAGDYLENGARLYTDMHHLEYCTPECLGPYQAAAIDLAGVETVRRVVDASGFDHRGIYRVGGTVLNPAKKENYTSGIHENYMIPKEAAYGKLLSSLALSHLASRLWSMNGNVVDGTYEFSQKINGVGLAEPFARRRDRLTTAGNKLMAIIPSVDNDSDILLDNDQWARIEMRYTDPQQSLEGRQLSLASTSLVLYMAEQQERLLQAGVEFDSLVLKHPAEAAHVFAHDLTLKTVAETESGKMMSACDIGEALVERARILCSMVELPADEVDAIEQWQDVNDALRRSRPDKAEYDPYLLRKIDVAAKHYLIAQKSGWPIEDVTCAQATSLLWDRVYPVGVGRRYWDKVQPDSAEKIKEATKTIPPTRAMARAALIHESSAIISVVTWRRMVLRNNTEAHFSDPYSTECDESVY